MINLNQIIVLAAWLAVPVSIWFIVYFSVRLVLHYRIRKDLGDMPTSEQISEHYKNINLRNQPNNHFPSVKRSDLK